ncbi:MAG: DUF1289 domain-containing protein [Proteobacteria bacterium]|nr:DUF1289 domain-containing protein [Pseudomonadota bacterium]
MTISPCVRNCCLDENDICLGCYRSLDEIPTWQNSSTARKSHILAQCSVRRNDYISARPVDDKSGA